ncbi:hypothetical protein ACJMK2_019820 [Sinanodonta woodiana]|uniref:Uncharacterized protein n=1 Tax=Sinanodonta woodiana TaxID=1069815 RepID=A0ABD3TX51_SINWO
MVMYQRENSSMSRACAVYKILIYVLVTHLYCMLAEGVKIHDVKYFDGEELVTIYKISLQRCVCECKAKKNRCLSVNYKRAFTSCRLNVNKPNTEEELLDKPGSVYIEMNDDDISGCDIYKTASNTDKYVVPFNQPACGKPGQKANASTMGNVYSNGSRIKYVCSERFKQLDQTESVSVCLHNGSWSHINFTCKPDTIGKSCSSNQECLEKLSECRQGLCFCLRNHIYSLIEYACVPGRGNYLISGPDVIPDDHFMASSSYDEPEDIHKPWLARLDSQEIIAYDSKISRCGCWAAKYQNQQQFIQVDMTNLQFVTAVTTKGRDPKRYTQFVKSYKVLYSVDGVSFITVLDHNGTDMIFPGNTLEEIHSAVTNELPCPIQTRYIRINPQDWYQHISLRFDVIGSTIYSADCDFENGTCGWQNEAASVIQWHTGKPNNTEGGPVNDHTYSGDPVTAGTFLYITTIQQEHATAQMSVSIKESNVSRCLSLWHTASKNYSGSLNVITAKCNIGIEQLRNTTHTNFAETWNLSTVRVESGVYKIDIEGVWTSATRGFLAIDDVKLNENDCL